MLPSICYNPGAEVEAECVHSVEENKNTLPMKCYVCNHGTQTDSLYLHIYIFLWHFT